MRYFTPWNKDREVEDHMLPKDLRDLTGQKHVPFGDGVLEALDTVIAAESCEVSDWSRWCYTDKIQVKSSSHQTHHISKWL